MSYRIHRAMGWAMPWVNFSEQAMITPDEGDDLSEALDNKFASLKENDLTIPMEFSKNLFYAGAERAGPPILETNLLATAFTNGNRIESKNGNSVDLYKCVATPDRTSDILFFPNLQFAKKWYRVDDDMDYAFEQWRGLKGRREAQVEPRDFVVYLEYGHYPWTNDLMDLQGAPVPWKHFLELENDKSIVPAVPSEIRWYLTRNKILSDESVNQLRPAIAQYWT